MDKRINRLTGLGILIALVVILQFLSNYITFGPISITLALVPIVLGAIIYGPLGGLILGVVLGAVVLVAPSTAGFLSFHPVITVFLCLLKSGLAGLAAGFIFMPFKGKHELVGSILAAIAVPIINTGLFALGTTLFFTGLFGYEEASSDFIYYLFIVVIGVNFIVEFAVNSALSPTIFKIYSLVSKREKYNN